MSITYCIEIILDAYLNENSIELILKRAQEAECTFYEAETYEYFEQEKNTPISINQAVTSIFELYQESEHGGPIIVKKDSTEVLLSFNTKHNNLTVFLIPFAYHWEKEFSNGEYQKDFARYIELLLAITQDLPIINVTIKQQ